MDSGGCSATGRRGSAPEGLRCELGDGVGFVSGVGIECGARFAILRNAPNEETATSGDCGESREAAAGPNSLSLSRMFYIHQHMESNSRSFADRSFSLVCSFNPFSLSDNFLPLIGDTGVAGLVG